MGPRVPRHASAGGTSDERTPMMCGSIPAPMTTPMLPNTAAGGGANPANTATNTANAGATATGGGDKATGSGPDPSKLPVNGGGAADGAANLQLQQTLTSLVQALSALTELLRNMPSSGVAGANGPGTRGGGPDTKGGGPEGKVGGQADGPARQSPIQVTQGGGADPTQGGGCLTPPPYIPALPGSNASGGGSNSTSERRSSTDGHNHAH